MGRVFTGAEEEKTDAEGGETGDGGDLRVGHAFDVGKPEELALAGLEGGEEALHFEGGCGVGGDCGFGGICRRGIFVVAPAIAEEVGGDAEEIAAGLIERHGGGTADEEAAEGLLEEIFGDVWMTSDAAEIGEQRARGGSVEDLEGGGIGGCEEVLRGGESGEGGIGSLDGHGYLLWPGGVRWCG